MDPRDTQEGIHQLARIHQHYFFLSLHKFNFFKYVPLPSPTPLPYLPPSRNLQIKFPASSLVE